MNTFTSRVELEWSRAPRDFFFAPGMDPGLWTLGPMPRGWDRIAPGRIAALAVSDHEALERATQQHITSTFRQRLFRSALVMRSVPVVMEHVTTEGHYLACHGKYFVNGAAGTRLRTKYAWANVGKRDANGEIAAYFRSLQDGDPELPVWPGGTEGLDYVIDARNGFNFYHFLTESMGQLCAVDRDDFRGRIYIHVDREKIEPFIHDWIAILFPRLAGRVEFRWGRHSYDRCLSLMNKRHLWYQTGPRAMDDLDDVAPETRFWKGRKPDRTSLLILAQNVCDDTLLHLRETALKRIEGGDWAHLPRRFWVARRSQRERPMRGEADLVAALAERGFETVHFEDYTPLEQIAIMARAEVMISHHGAAFANMLFARPEAHCIEIGTYQTARWRWRDFMPHAIASGCRYTSLFADFNADAPIHRPEDVRSRPLHPVGLDAGGRGRVIDYVDAVTRGVRIADDNWLKQLALGLERTGDTAALTRLLDDHAAAVRADADLTIRRANLHLAAGDKALGRRLLERAWEMTGDRPFLLERLILLHAAEGGETPWIARHRKIFPDRAHILDRKLAPRARTER
ncbi:Capsular polysaccharide biosynthesis protein [Jannaschia seosinensis]|uniref:Capsular polysaccharide biosynthesis protein n=1 Tax=Jannaschia seosinensis TaxID=313367 RepID=A0A0M7B4L2_9RHOB|nr:glycosyltransferase family 61 protein [Jannaschia seosinensis]CUH15077.1 Capsular polysaccharide biosynthesis protein [Jannaschia seosinensis]